MSVKITNASPYIKIRAAEMEQGDTVFGYVLSGSNQRQRSEPAIYMRTWAGPGRYRIVDLKTGESGSGPESSGGPLTIEGRPCDLEITVVEAL